MGLSVGSYSEPSVLISEIKDAVPIYQTNTEHDSELTRLEKMATEVLEKECLRSFVTRTNVLTIDRFPPDGLIPVPRPPLIQVNSITYIDTEGDSQTWSSSKYQISIASEPGRITPAYGESWPSTRTQMDSVVVDYDAGYGADETSVPNGIKLAVITCVVNWFKGLTPEGEIPAAAKLFIRRYRHGFAGELFGVAS